MGPLKETHPGEATICGWDMPGLLARCWGIQLQLLDQMKTPKGVLRVAQRYGESLDSSNSANLGGSTSHAVP